MVLLFVILQPLEHISFEILYLECLLCSAEISFILDP